MLNYVQTPERTTMHLTKAGRQLPTRPAPYPKALRALIREAGYRFREVSEETDIPESTLYDWASGRRPIPHRERPRLAHLLGCAVEELAPQAASLASPPESATPVTPRTVTLGQTTITVDQNVFLEALSEGLPCYVIIGAVDEALPVGAWEASKRRTTPRGTEELGSC